MQVIYIILTIIAFAGVNVLLAYIDSRQFAKGKTISHFINAVEYVALIAVPFFIFKNYWMIAALLFERLLVFNISLSLWRNLKWDYISPERKSIIDRVAFLFFGYNGKLMYVVYVLLFIVFLFLTLKYI